MLASLMKPICVHPAYRCSTLCFYCFPVPMTAVHDSRCFGPPILVNAITQECFFGGEFLDIYHTSPPELTFDLIRLWRSEVDDLVFPSFHAAPSLPLILILFEQVC